MKKGYKECPFCANEIREGAKKCQYCHELLDEDFNKDQDNKENVIINDKKQIESCIKTGRNGITWGWISVLGLILIVIFSFFSFEGKVEEEVDIIVTLMMLGILIAIIYYFVWLVKNYRILLKSNVEGLACKSCGLLILYWLCPILNLFKPQETLEDILRNSQNKIGKNYENKPIKIRGILWNITLISFALMFFEPALLSAIAIFTFIISYCIQQILLIRIMTKIILAQEASITKK